MSGKLIVCILIILILFWIILGVIKVKNNEKYLKDCEDICANAKKAYQIFISELKDKLNIIPNFNFDNSNFVNAINMMVYSKIKYGFENKILEEGIERFNRFSDKYLDVLSLIDDCKRKCDKYIKCVSENLNNWYSTYDEIPMFFKLDDIFCGEAPIYCYCPNISIDETTKNINGVIFKHNKICGRAQVITPYNYKLTPMTKYEFETYFLPNRLDVMEFSDERVLMSYQKFLISEYSKFSKL